ncbi:MAG TPA: winged helix-turn-helix domain-containing protein [Candidatus Lachnoclostridium stercoripullorum]|uniref:Winged helix-turn-helix domain-containing protein n=1 Tax=Candidatus Lachnoclostridium stercoripullorum TaxID=2838635 RepID=A0A9D2AVQ9_9FIRM|nr:winged helix-turn-helix domain-containing protein [Candidatus Lachnoclostridium stercoripullorum]
MSNTVQIVHLLIRDNRLSQKQIAAKTGRSIASVQRVMKRLSEQGKLVREGGECFEHWEVK